MAADARKRHLIDELTDAQLRQLLSDAQEHAYGGANRAVARAALGTLFLVLSVVAATDLAVLEWVLLSGLFIVGLAAYIWLLTRSSSAREHARTSGMGSRRTNGVAPPRAADAPRTARGSACLPVMRSQDILGSVRTGLHRVPARSKRTLPKVS